MCACFASGAEVSGPQGIREMVDVPSLRRSLLAHHKQKPRQRRLTARPIGVSAKGKSFLTPRKKSNTKRCVRAPSPTLVSCVRWRWYVCGMCVGVGRCGGTGDVRCSGRPLFIRSLQNKCIYIAHAASLSPPLSPSPLLARSKRSTRFSCASWMLRALRMRSEKAPIARSLACA
jgi:hypothetical protein